MVTMSTLTLETKGQQQLITSRGSCHVNTTMIPVVFWESVPPQPSPAVILDM